MNANRCKDFKVHDLQTPLFCYAAFHWGITQKKRNWEIQGRGRGEDELVVVIRIQMDGKWLEGKTEENRKMKIVQKENERRVEK
mgnify:CR=1 FL=1